MSTYYELYLKSVFDLARSIVVKYTPAARAINAHLSKSGYQVSTDQRTWKYYLNMAGQYHEYDLPMTVLSLDTQTPIDFTVDNLRIHRNTLREYSKQGVYFTELVAKYPDQEDLIRGILNPVDLDFAINSSDHRILTYNPELVESGETYLISTVQSRIDAILERWEVSGYELVENMYQPTLLGAIYAFLPSIIINARLAYCKTDFAHSYHIREYFKSNGAIDRFYDYMTREQRLWFYRNIQYVLRNSGQMRTFDTLVEQVMTARSFPLDRYTLRHNYKYLLEDLTPAVEMFRSSVNQIINEVSGDVKTVPYILDKETPLAVGNAEERAYAERYIPEQMRHSLTSDVRTKVLESDILDHSGSGIVSLEDVLLNHWGYMAITGHYTTVTTVENPLTGEMMRVDALEGFTLFLYCYYKARGLELPTPPNMLMQYVTRNPKPERSELLALSDRELVPEYFIDECYYLSVDITPTIAIESFRNLCLDIHEAIRLQHDLGTYQPDWRVRALLRITTDRFYMDYPADFGSHTSYSDWFRDKGYSIEALSDIELDNLASSLLATFTGQEFGDQQSLREVHEAMVRLMEHLVSYSVQFITTSNQSTIVYVDKAYIKPGDVYINPEHAEAVRNTPIVVLSESGVGLHTDMVDKPATSIDELDVTPITDVFVDKTENTGVSIRAEFKEVANKPVVVWPKLPDTTDLSSHAGEMGGYELISGGLPASALFSTDTIHEFTQPTSTVRSRVRTQISSLAL